MVLTRATTSPGADGVLGDNPTTIGVDESLDDGRPVNTTTSFVDQNQTYTSHSSHQVFIRQYELNADRSAGGHRQPDRGRQWRHGYLGRSSRSRRATCSASS